MDKYINAPISDEDAKSLHSGDYVYITGTICVGYVSILIASAV